MTGNSEAVRIAREWIGTPFVAGAKVKGQGVDCAQLLVAIYEELTGGKFIVPSYKVSWLGQLGTYDLYTSAVAEKMILVGHSWKRAEIGDVVLMAMRKGRPIQHGGIKSGPDSMIHALDGHKVCEARVGILYSGKVRSAFRFPDSRAKGA